MPSLTAPVPHTGPAVVPLTEQKKECRERGGEITRGVGMRKWLSNGLGPPPCSLHYRVERSCGPRFVGASLPADAKSLGLAFVRAPWRRLCRAGGVTRTGVGRGGVWSAATAWLGEPAGTPQGSLGPPGRLMRKVLDSPSSEPRGGGESK